MTLFSDTATLIGYIEDQQMTAEVAIMNRAAVSMAADSAVTIHSEPKEAGTIPRIYTTVNKLFALSKYHPVGIMVYGSADILGRSWEPIIKIYRKQLSDRHFDSLDQYAGDFARYLGNKTLFPPDLQEAYYHSNLLAYYGLITDEIQHSVKRLFEHGEKPKSTEIAKTISTVISRYHAEISKLKYIQGMNSKTFQRFQTIYSSILDRSIESAFEKLTITKASLTH